MAAWRGRPWSCLVDVICGSSVVTFLALAESGLVPCARPGFYCEDPALGFRFRGDTVSMTALLAPTALAPLLVVWLVEAWGRPGPAAAAGQLSGGGGSEVRRRSEAGARLTAVWYREFLLGLGLVVLVTDLAKVLAGEPRPHFLHTCRPDAARNCTPGRYVADYTCTNNEQSSWFVQDATKSFPSGHASISVYTSLFLMWFLQRRLPTASWLLVPWLQALCVLWALLCSLTRITDHRHHWWDVLAGAVLGVITAVFTVLNFCKGFVGTNVSMPADLLTKGDSLTHENGILGGRNAFTHTRHHSVRRLLSSTSSCTGDFSPEDQEMQETP